MLGNILLVLVILFLFGLIQTTASPMPGGDRGVGAAFVLFVCGAGFILFTGLLALNLGWNNAFDWVPGPSARRNWLIFLGWLAFASATFASAMFRVEWHQGEFPQYLQYLRWLARAQAVVWLPLLALVPAFLLMNFDRPAGTAPDFVKIPMLTGFLLSVLMSVGLLFGFFRGSAQQAAARVQFEQEQNDKLHNQHLEYIAEQKPTDPIVNILSLTGRFHDADVRDAAVNKVKTHPDWEAELIRLLNDTEWHSQVYQFIDGNRVDHPELFVEPINRSIRRMAAAVRKSIKDSNNLQDWHFEHLSLERLFRAIDEQFSLPGADYRPAVLELRQALDTPKPERFKNVKFTVTRLVDDWLKKKQ